MSYRAISSGTRVIFHGPKIEQVVETAELPEIQEGEILGKVRSATICGSDLHTILGRRKEPTPRYVFLFIMYYTH